MSKVTRDPAYLNSLRELKWIVGIGLSALLWTICYGGFAGYRNPTAEPGVTLGMPSWVFWGIALPWVVTGAATIFFAVFVMREDDDDLAEQLEDVSIKDEQASGGDSK